MKPQNARFLFLILTIETLTFPGCLTSASNANNQEIKILNDKVNLLSTQNAQLDEIIKNIESSSSITTEDLEEIQPTTENPETSPPESLPKEPVKAGQPINFNDWSIIVANELNVCSNKEWGITITVRNLSDKDRVFRFSNSSITASDDLGNIYPPYSTAYDNYYYDIKNLDVSNQNYEIIDTGDCFYSFEESNRLNSFAGPLPIEASYLILHFEEFGPFDNIDVIIDL